LFIVFYRRFVMREDGTEEETKDGRDMPMSATSTAGMAPALSNIIAGGMDDGGGGGI
jgi:hypothetical protein